uniref:Uncharacterized protein n=1 Tax=Arundo donax TaxID=35708 RepID=A0A0A9CIC0_ARUDO
MNCLVGQDVPEGQSLFVFQSILLLFSDIRFWKAATFWSNICLLQLLFFSFKELLLVVQLCKLKAAFQISLLFINMSATSAG